MNTVSLIGRLTADPNIRAGEKHESASFRLAVPRRRCDKDAADFIDIVTFDTLAATCGEYLTKGRLVAVPAGSASTSGPPPTGSAAPSSRSSPTTCPSWTSPRTARPKRRRRPRRFRIGPRSGATAAARPARPAPEGAATLAPGWPPPSP